MSSSQLKNEEDYKKMFNVDALRRWFSVATPLEKAELERVTGVSKNYLYQIMNGNRAMSASKAGIIVETANDIGKHSNGRLPVLKRRELCEACKNCPHSK